MKKIKIILCLLFSVLLNTTGMAQDIETIRFATEPTYPPFEYVDVSGNVQGFDIDIAKAICHEMRVRCTFSTQSFNSLIPSLKFGKFDAIIAAISVTTERKKEVDFTQPYYEPSASFVSMKSSDLSLVSILTLPIGVQQGSTFEKYLREKYNNSLNLKIYISIQDALLDLMAGRISSVLTDTPIAKAWMQKNNQYMIVGKPIIDHAYFGNGYAIAVKKNNVNLIYRMNKALTEIKKNGIYQKIIEKHFNLS